MVNSTSTQPKIYRYNINELKKIGITPVFKDDKTDELADYFLLTAQKGREYSPPIEYKLQLYSNACDYPKIPESQFRFDNPQSIFIGVTKAHNNTIALVERTENIDSNSDYPKQNPIKADINNNGKKSLLSIAPSETLTNPPNPPQTHLDFSFVEEKLSSIVIKPVYKNGELQQYFLLSAKQENVGDVEFIMKLHSSEDEYNNSIPDNSIYGVLKGGYRNRFIEIVKKSSDDYPSIINYPKQNPLNAHAIEFKTCLTESTFIPTGGLNEGLTQAFVKKLPRNLGNLIFNTEYSSYQESSSYQIWLNSLPEN